MLLVPVIAAIKAKLIAHADLKDLKYVQVLPDKNIQHPFICLPYTTGSAKMPFSRDDVSGHAINERGTLHEFDIPILVAVSMHKAEDALAKIDPLQQAMFTLLNDDMTFGGAIKSSEVTRQYSDAFINIGDEYVGVVFTLSCKAFEPTPVSIYDSWIETEDITITVE